MLSWASVHCDQKADPALRPLLRVVDEHGEIHEGCPACAEAERTLVQYEKDLRVLKAKITKLERDTETECRADPLWTEAECLHEYWALSCKHEGCKFTAEEFFLIKPHLKRIGPIGCLQAVSGAAFDPRIDFLKNGREKRRDDWGLVFRSKEKVESFMERAPGLPDPNAWKFWLVNTIESGLKGAPAAQ